MSEIKEALFKRLREFHNDKNFVLGVMYNAQLDENYQKIMDFMDEGEDVTVDNLLLLALALGKGIDPLNMSDGDVMGGRSNEN